ncbi:hypothetical protein EDB19DRAFT_1905985 [Suillus lakei]|nr:hypothetical protein EDB19DRAFT_1905985 [Suillus lakei]
MAPQNKDYNSFWNPFFEDWAAKFPEREIIFLDIPLDVDLTAEQKNIEAEVWKLWQQQLMEKLRNDLNSSKAGRRANATHNAIVSNMVGQIMKASKEKPSHSLQGWEMYVHLHYHDKVKDTVKSLQDTLKSDPNAKPAKKTNLSIIKEQTKLVFEGESKGVKEEIQVAIEVMKEKKRVEMDKIKKNSASLDNTFYISKIGAILTQFFEELHLMTGWTFSVLMGGPDPAAAEAAVLSTPGTTTSPEDATLSPAPADISAALTKGSESPVNVDATLSPSPVATPSADSGQNNPTSHDISAILNTTNFFSSPHLQCFTDDELELPPLDNNADNPNPQLPILPMLPQWQIPAASNGQSTLAADARQSLSLLDLLHSPNIDLPPPQVPPSVSGVTSPHLRPFFTSPSNIYDFTHDDGLDAGGNSSPTLPLADTASVSHTDAPQHSAITPIPPQCQQGSKCTQRKVSISATNGTEEDNSGHRKCQHFQLK